MNSWEIRRLTPADLAEMRAVHAMFGEAFDDRDRYSGNPPTDAYLVSLLSSSTFLALAAFLEGAIVGGLTAYELCKPEREAKEIYLYDLAVAAAFRRHGIATALLHAIRTIARERAAEVVFVQADAEDEAAIALYAGLGEQRAVYHFDLRPVDPST